MLGTFLSIMFIVLLPMNGHGAESLLKLLGPNIKAKAEDVVCLQCHPDVSDNTMNYLHYPAGVGACNYCHIARPEHLQGDNPPESVSINRTSENCYNCHDRKDEKPVKHGALADPESCIRCHNPHSSNTRHLLQSDTVPTLCSTCHRNTVVGKSQHGPAIKGKACIHCHNPHSATEQKLLHRPAKELCLSCHNEEIKATLNDSRIIPNIKKKLELTGVHPGANGTCLDCHKPHASDNLRLLTARWSVATYNQYSEQQNPYGLCFTCHETDMLQQSDFETKTGFRDNHTRMNLHWFHVVDAAGNTDKSRGRSCKICHDPHGAPQAHDINSAWLMNGNPIPIEYQVIESGGQCTKSCHSLRVYKR
ncbi:MAG: hypothetical protein A2X86_15470 [Bdellovibrionales bacterium GWA2_49_15]|nr:MAG: hypothetical protein A2X86_15470 [Bdellovibrionales bacterium GWA2_49_15]HAZ14529.1 hypothetical protein [Bdellovibrionales bacterium]